MVKISFPATYDIAYYRGDRLEFVAVPRNADGSDFDLTGYTAEMLITDKAVSPLTFNATVVVDDILNVITCTILPANGATLVPGTVYYYDLEITTGATVVYTILRGTISVTEDITP